MNVKNAIRACLLLFVAGSLVYTMLREPAPRGDAGIAPAAAVDPEVVVYFFYNDIRCESCLRIEAYAKEALDAHFADELASGRIVWRPLSMEAPENQHYLTDYGLFSKSVVLVEMERGEQLRWKNLEEIWDLVYDKPAYLEYIRANLQDFLRAAP